MILSNIKNNVKASKTIFNFLLLKFRTHKTVKILA